MVVEKDSEVVQGLGAVRERADAHLERLNGLGALRAGRNEKEGLHRLQSLRGDNTETAAQSSRVHVQDPDHVLELDALDVVLPLALYRHVLAELGHGTRISLVLVNVPALPELVDDAVVLKDLSIICSLVEGRRDHPVQLALQLRIPVRGLDDLHGTRPRDAVLEEHCKGTHEEKPRDPVHGGEHALQDVVVDDSLHLGLARDKLDALLGEGHGCLEDPLALVRIGE